MMLATLLHNFGWELDIKSEEMDMNEKFGFTVQKAIPLKAVPKKLRRNRSPESDLAFSSRTIPSAAAALNHEEFSMVWLPVENQWRKLRKICKEQMSSVARLDASQGVRREKL
ncbi:cytochrome [Sesamum angolense]|uniref:Cytochrome n=1 Tax=Sesamum angolense TaxID=2727404 RepID=A0AAE1XH18_9LAMI|nr:cytochrome [Sesamum angolense]